MTKKGFLLVLMQPPPSFEEEFNAWYDTEHVPERLAVPGFKTGLRYVCISGSPRYLAIYDLESPAVLETPAYLRVSFESSSPWTKRVVSRVRVYRSAGVQIYPGDAVTGRAARLLLLRYRGLPADAEAAVVRGMRAAFEHRAETAQVRGCWPMTPGRGSTSSGSWRRARRSASGSTSRRWARLPTRSTW